MNHFDTEQPLPDFARSSADRSMHNALSPRLRRQPNGRLMIPNGLVVTSEYHMRGNLGEALLLCGIAPVFAASLRDALHHLSNSPISFIVCEHRLPDGDYTDLLHRARSADIPSPLIVISPTGDWSDYFEALDLGAYDFLAFPLIPGELQRIITNHLKMNFEFSMPLDPLT
jgi:DNA-binding NtrC family response regulator